MYYKCHIQYIILPKLTFNFDVEYSSGGAVGGVLGLTVVDSPTIPGGVVDDEDVPGTDYLI